MEKYVPEAGFGNLFVNETKEGKQPDRRGKLAVPFDCKKGDVLDISGWIKEGKKNNYLSLTAQAEWKSEEKPKSNTGFDGMDDDLQDIPF